MNAALASLNGIAIGFNSAALLFLQMDQTWPTWVGIGLCSICMVSLVIKISLAAKLRIS